MEHLPGAGNTAREEVLREQVRLAIGQIPTMQGASYAVSLIIAVVMWGTAPSANIAIWIGMVTAVAAARVVLYFRFRPLLAEGDFDARQWHDRYLGLALLSGMFWAASAFLLFPSGDVLMQSFLILVMTSLAASTVVSHPSVKLAPAVWIVPVMAAYSARFMWEGGGVRLALGVLLLLYIFTLVRYSFRIFDMMAASIAGRFENLDLLEEVRQATRLKDKFVSLVSHDLRAPVAGMRSAADYVKELLEKDPADPHTKSLASSISESAGSLLNLLDQLLDISRLQSGRIIPVKRTLHLRQLAEEKIKLFAQAAEKKVLTIRNDLPGDMRVIADPALYGQVIGNLLGNAVKFCNAGGQVRLFAPEGSVNTVAIGDTGVGIRSEMLPDLFKSEVKTTTYGTAGEVGTGLGLPYSLEIIRAHGGDINVESQLGAGSTFFVSLPKTVTTILIVDDQEAHRRMMKQLLAKNVAVEVIEADNGYEAMEELANTVPDLIVTDIQMKFGGVEFIRELKKDPRYRHVPVIVATATAASDPRGLVKVREEFFQIGADDFVMKPVVEEDFIPRVKRFL